MLPGRAQGRRCATLGNAQSGEIRDKIGGRREREIAIELQTVGGNGNGRRFPHFRNHAAVNGGTSRLASLEPRASAVVYSSAPSGAAGISRLSVPKLAIRANAPPDARGQRTRTALLPITSNPALLGSTLLMRGKISFRRSARSSR